MVRSAAAMPPLGDARACRARGGGMAGPCEKQRRHGRRTPLRRDGVREARESFGEDVGAREQGDDEVAVAVEVEEVAGMDDDAAFFDEAQRELFIGFESRYAHDRRPPALDR